MTGICILLRFSLAGAKLIGGEVEKDPDDRRGLIEQPSSSTSSKTLGSEVERSGFEALHINCSFSIDSKFTCNNEGSS